MNNRTKYPTQGRIRHVLDLFSIAARSGSRRQGVTCLNPDTMGRLSLARRSHSRRMPVTNLTPATPFRRSRRSAVLVKRVHWVRAPCEHESGFRTSSFGKLTSFLTMLHVVFTIH